MAKVHAEKRRNGHWDTLCGRGWTTPGAKKQSITCGRCKLLAKFAAKRAKKGKV